MKSFRSPQNPYSYGNPRCIVWEFMKGLNGSELHLDYGTHDGEVINNFSRANLIDAGVGVDLNKQAIEKARNNSDRPKNVKLKHIEKGKKLPFEDETFTSISLIGVLEHIYDQSSTLKELRRVLKKDGKILIIVPGKYFLSFLDLGNLKFYFPKLHKFGYELFVSKDAYKKRYIDCPDGLFGDIEIEKMWHQHFTHTELRNLLEENGLNVEAQDGMGFFYRIFIIISIFTPKFLSKYIKQLADIDGKVFSSAEIGVVATK